MANVQVEIPSNFPQSFQTLGENVPRIALSFAVWLTLFFFTGWISRTLIPKVRTLKPKEQMFWQLAMVRGMCGLLTIWAAYLIFVDERLSRDYVRASTDASWTILSVLSGFFLFEEVALIYFDIKYRTFSKELHLHHFFVFVTIFLSLYYNICHYNTIKSFLLEASTPFSCICWCLLKLKLEKTKAWKINQWILIYIFHLRTVYELGLWYDYYKNWDDIKQYVPWSYAINMLVAGVIVTFWLTPYWTYKKTVQFFYPTDWNAETSKGRKKDDEIDKTS